MVALDQDDVESVLDRSGQLPVHRQPIFGDSTHSILLDTPSEEIVWAREHTWLADAPTEARPVRRDRAR
jgi:hypothetical protein